MTNKKEKQNEVEVEFELEEEQIKLIEKLAEEEGCSFNDMVVQILENFIKKEELESEVKVEKVEEDSQ